jgi:hypothetical protein
MYVMQAAAQDILLKNLPAEQKKPPSCPCLIIKMTLTPKITLVSYYYLLIFFKLYKDDKV